MKILKLPVSDPKKFGPKRAQKKRKLEEEGQLNLFSGRVLPLHARSAFEEALRRDEKGDLDEAKKLYHQAIRKDDTVSDAYCNLGIIESGEGNVALAINYLTLCLKHDPRHFEAHFNLANIYGEAGNKELAKLHFEIAIEIEPEFPNSYFNLGLLLAMEHQYAKAVEVLQTYCKLVSEREQETALELLEKLRAML
ncbi:tetratricopeptide repeat protein [Aliifodinibius sp. S!AR15-10]|uniref:tetratricopeptide repeat protein n=1 Tax=Aliifodinibius sp. S!AR15-10 TaxID=2950437 RepID=UPI00285FE024|nr:tetratricopeptide repeat protein [Aliifodinibius sp. S!AR15-10]MDR8392591.1 tetratricopeptide repeat protein [Aliifodinibius sp. S!AR15-10]